MSNRFGLFDEFDSFDWFLGGVVVGDKDALPCSIRLIANCAVTVESGNTPRSDVIRLIRPERGEKRRASRFEQGCR